MQSDAFALRRARIKDENVVDLAFGAINSASRSNALTHT